MALLSLSLSLSFFSLSLSLSLSLSYTHNIPSAEALGKTKENKSWNKSLWNIWWSSVFVVLCVFMCVYEIFVYFYSNSYFLQKPALRVCSCSHFRSCTIFEMFVKYGNGLLVLRKNLVSKESELFFF